ncbi:MAG: hypothetical protein WC346_18250 [Methanogenium sp.]|jgi:cell division protein FtsB
MTDPIITWNLLVTAVGFPLLAWFIKRSFDRRDKLEEKVNDDFRQGLKKDVERINCRLDMIDRNLNLKLDKEEYERKSDDKWEMIQHHTHDDKGRVVVP